MNAGRMDDDAGRTDDDAGRTDNDAGLPAPEAGWPIDDTGRPDDDAARTDDDAGRLEDEAGLPIDDTGWADDDAGLPAHEAGPPIGEAGRMDDKAGPPIDDTGRTDDDAGPPDHFHRFPHCDRPELPGGSTGMRRITLLLAASFAAMAYGEVIDPATADMTGTFVKVDSSAFPQLRLGVRSDNQYLVAIPGQFDYSVIVSGKIFLQTNAGYQQIDMSGMPPHSRALLWTTGNKRLLFPDRIEATRVVVSSK